MNKCLLFIAYITIACTFSVSAQNHLYEGPPAFHGAKVVGNYPGTELIFTVPATGERPITFSAVDLPKGLSLDATNGIIRGTINEPGVYKVKITAANIKGKAEEELKFEIGDVLCLTPALGWNSWNVFTKNINEAMIIEMADAMVKTGMRDVGYQYINIDDFWHADTRDSTGKPVPDPKKFPHGMKYVADYIHSKGLKFGIYSCAGNMTCGRRFGGYKYEEIDAKTYAEWGVDLLKYDYCYAPAGRKEAIKRYSTMAAALKHSGRSIVFSICEWGVRKPWQWAAKAGGNYWRDTPDIMDSWRFPSLFVWSNIAIINRCEKLWKYGGPGHWNDLDMLTVGNYGKGNATSGGGLYKGMNDIEYQTQFSLWSMFSAPLLASCDLRKMNEPTDNILTNFEMLDIDQNELGEPAKPVYRLAGIRVYMKRLKDEGIAIAVFNSSKHEKKFELKPALLGLIGNYNVRDVWQHAETGSFNNTTTLLLKSHQTVVLKLTPTHPR
jgi:alpha-galactosidase